MALLLTILLDAAVKGSIVLLTAAALMLVLRRASAAVRHLVWFLALASLLVLPVLSMSLPAWRIPVVPPRVGWATPTASSQRPANASQDRVGNAYYFGSLMLAWAVGGFLAIGLLLVGTARVWRLTRQSQPVEDATWASLLRELAPSPRVRLVASHDALIPMTWGVRRPVILLPSQTADWTTERRRVVLTHELAHVRRRDYLTQTIAWVACALHWFNPLVWFALRRMRTEREQACDDYVLNAGLKPSDYASHLLAIVRSLRPLRASSVAAVAMARPSRLARRLEAVLDIHRSRRAATRALVLLATALALCLLIPLGALRPVAKAQEAQRQTRPAADLGKKAEDTEVAPGGVSQPDREQGEVTGRVEDDEGRPLSGVRVAAAPRDVRYRLYRAPATSTARSP